MKRIYLITVMVIAMGFTVPPTVRAGGFGGSRDNKSLEAQMVEDAVGYGALCVTRSGVTGWLKSEGLVPDDAYAVWWVYFDDPNLSMVPGACGSPHYGGEDPLGVFGHRNSSIAPNNDKLYFYGRIGGFTPTSGAQIWMW